jgi:hypothetical protein
MLTLRQIDVIRAIMITGTVVRAARLIGIDPNDPYRTHHGRGLHRARIILRGDHPRAVRVHALRDKGVTIVLIEQNAKQALQMPDCGLVLEQRQTRIEDTAHKILDDPRIAQLFLGGGLQAAEVAA